MTDTKLLKATMILKNDTVSALAEAIGTKRQALSCKINNKREFKQHEIASIASRYKLTGEQIIEIFFSGGIAQ